VLSSVKIEGFKGIKLEVNNLTQLNIITGKNNQGKTTFLESLYLLNSKRVDNLIEFYQKSEMFWKYDHKISIIYQVGFNKKRYDLVYTDQRQHVVLDIRRHLSDLASDSDLYFNAKDRGLFYFDPSLRMLTNELGTSLRMLTNELGNCSETKKDNSDFALGSSGSTSLQN
jgi:predicted ATPase